MKKTLSIVAAMKYMKALEAAKSGILSDEANTREYEEIDGKAIEIPVYDLAETQAKLKCIDETVREIKHAINKSNTVDTISSIGMTPDIALITMAQLSNRLKVVDAMALVPGRKRVREPYGASTANVVSVRNYPAEEAKAVADSIRAELSTIQMALDAHNMSTEVTFDDYMK